MKRAHYPEQAPDVEELVKSHLDLVRRIAWNLYGRVSNAIEIEDLIQIGYFGLITAAQKYTPQEGAAFASYASLRIRGAMVDYLRKNSNLCRTTIRMRQRATAVEDAFIRAHHRSPRDDEMAKEMGLPVSEWLEWQNAFAANTHKSLDAVYNDYSIWFASPGENPEEAVSDTDLRKLLRQALEVLPEREALVVQLFYVEELNIYEVAEILEVTTGRISQIKKAAISRIREHIRQSQDGIL